MIDKKAIKKTLAGISTTLDHFIRREKDPGLLTGYLGTALFYAYYYRLTGKKQYLTTVNDIIEKAIKALAEKELLYSHCNGIAGMAWCIHHLMKYDFITGDLSQDIFKDLDDALSGFMDHDLIKQRYDFLHEGLGVALYFLDKLPDTSAQSYLENSVTQLEQAAIINNAGISWEDNFTEKNGDDSASPGYNLGLAHGVPAILSILSMIYEKNIATTKARRLLEQGTNWLLDTKNKPAPDCISLYPTMVTGNNKALGAKQSRLGWCYGDLGIAITLWNTGARLENDSYKQEAYTIFEHTLMNRNFENGSIADACLCHGSLGVSHIYRRLYINTGETIFLKGADQWLQQPLEMVSRDGGLTYFKYRTHKGYEINYNLLEGITGIGLALIAALDNDIEPAWDRCLLLS